MNEKKKNLIIRTITGVLFVAIMIAGFLNVQAMILLFALITGLTMWEYTGLINENTEGVYVNRFISTVAGVYLFFAVAGWVILVAHAPITQPGQWGLGQSGFR